MRYTLIDQTRLFMSGNDVNGETQDFVGTPEKFVAVSRLSQGLCSHRADLRFFEPRQPFPEAGQAVPPALHCVKGQVPVGVKPVSLPDSFFVVFGPLNAAMVQATNFQAEAVRPQIDSCQ